MRIIHFADLHIGVELYGRPLADRGWSSRMQDFLDAFDHLVEYALAERADAVIFAGDAYKAREPSQTHQREFARRIRRLTGAGIPVFLLVGNHDLPNAEGKAHALEIYRTLGIEHVYVGDNAWFAGQGYRPQQIMTRSGPLQVAFLPWPQVGRLLAADQDVAGMTIEQVNREVETRLTALIREQTEQLNPDVPSILTCHVSINDFLVRENPGSEQFMTIGSAPTLLKSQLYEQHFDYIALGHHHNNMDLQLNTPCWYSGSMQPVDFGEEKQPKGFMVFDIDTSKPRGQRIGGSGVPRLEQVPARRFVTISPKPKDDDPTAEVCRAVEAGKVEDAVVRVEVEMSREQLQMFRIPEVRQLLEKAHYVARIRPIVSDAGRISVPGTVDASSPLETLETFFKVKQYEEARRERLLSTAKDLIATVEDERD